MSKKNLLFVLSDSDKFSSCCLLCFVTPLNSFFHSVHSSLNFFVIAFLQVAPILAGVAVAAAAYAGKYGIEAWQAFKARPPRPKFRKFYEGGFQAAMTRREAALILGVRFVSFVSLPSLIYSGN